MRANILAGVTVIECATFVTGPYATALLADLGARVIKIEPVPDGDPYRYFSPDVPFSPNFAYLNRGKESMGLDLKTDPGQEICARLVERADVFVENFRPGVMDRLGLSYDRLRALNPRLAYCSISAFGPSGPYAAKPGFDTLGQAMSGLLSVLTDLDQPRVMGIAISDYVTGLSAAYGILGALLGREKTGEGAKVETSLLQATLSFMGETAGSYLKSGKVPDRMARVKNAHAFAFAAKDKLPLVIHCSVPEKFWLNLLKAIGRTDLAEDARFKTREDRLDHYEELTAELAETFASRTRGEWLQRLEENDVPAGPLYNMAEVVADPQVKHLRLVEEAELPGTEKFRWIGPPVHYPGLSRIEGGSPPLLGEHATTILAELGYDQTAVKKFKDHGVIVARKES